MKAILFGVFSFPIVVSAYAGLHYHYKLPSYVAVPVGATLQAINVAGIMIFMDDSE